MGLLMWTSLNDINQPKPTYITYWMINERDVYWAGWDIHFWQYYNSYDQYFGKTINNIIDCYWTS